METQPIPKKFPGTMWALDNHDRLIFSTEIKVLSACCKTIYRKTSAYGFIETIKGPGSPLPGHITSAVLILEGCNWNSFSQRQQCNKLWNYENGNYLRSKQWEPEWNLADLPPWSFPVKRFPAARTRSILSHNRCLSCNYSLAKFSLLSRFYVTFSRR